MIPEKKDHQATPIDPTTWRIAVRQFGMLMKLTADAVAVNGTVRGRVRKDARFAAEMIKRAADAAYFRMREPPATVGEAYELHEEAEQSWPKTKGDAA